ncbi:hypothetical protein FsymDg_1889 [Candidatus Protofrankia datiscae]|uniref:Uncharacterized protein n=1 Tax=Candidatus Protofrankia datiscae TaxID=2716812 RepID=F8AW06_9ACTN|nr:hypothetical protein FsymDg_1889 [Candidatus Protofrankia datiscae]
MRRAGRGLFPAQYVYVTGTGPGRMAVRAHSTPGNGICCTTVTVGVDGMRCPTPKRTLSRWLTTGRHEFCLRGPGHARLSASPEDHRGKCRDHCQERRDHWWWSSATRPAVDGTTGGGAAAGRHRAATGRHRPGGGPCHRCPPPDSPAATRRPAARPMPRGPVGEKHPARWARPVPPRPVPAPWARSATVGCPGWPNREVAQVFVRAVCLLSGRNPVLDSTEARS